MQLTSAGVFYLGTASIGQGYLDMKYTKPALPFEKQADLLLSRGLVADRAHLIRRLGITSYFRLSTYLYHFRVVGTDNFQPGTTLESVMQIYRFDQRLRTLMLDAIEVIEVYTRTQLAYHFANDFGPFAYANASYFPNLRRDQFLEWQRKLDDQAQRSLRSKEEFVTHFFNKYGDEHTRLPIWMLVELMDFGSTLTFFRGANDDIKKRIAGAIGQPDRVIMSWLLALNTIRNRCAHHARLWDWEIGTPVLIPQQRKFPSWHAPLLPNSRVGIALTISRYWQNQISPTNAWTQRIWALFDEFPLIDPTRMGLTLDWRNHPLWQSS